MNEDTGRRTVDAWQMAFARIVTHYFHHKAWLEEGILLRNAHKLAAIPGVMVQGRIDFGGPAGHGLGTSQSVARR